MLTCDTCQCAEDHKGEICYHAVTDQHLCYDCFLDREEGE